MIKVVRVLALDVLDVLVVLVVLVARVLVLVRVLLEGFHCFDPSFVFWNRASFQFGIKILFFKHVLCNSVSVCHEALCPHILLVQALSICSQLILSQVIQVHLCAVLDGCGSGKTRALGAAFASIPAALLSPGFVPGTFGGPALRLPGCTFLTPFAFVACTLVIPSPVVKVPTPSVAAEPLALLDRWRGRRRGAVDILMRYLVSTFEIALGQYSTSGHAFTFIHFVGSLPVFTAHAVPIVILQDEIQTDAVIHARTPTHAC